jgi:RHS repeat-associated protein
MRASHENYWPTGVESPVLAQHYALDDLGNIEALGPVAGVPAPTEYYGYDDLDRLTEVRDANQALIEAYAYDATGNRTSKTRGGATHAYGYPGGSHRLTGVGATARGYDANGNWTTAGGATVHTFDDRNRLVTGPGLVADYNGRGERVAANERVFGYDESGQLLYELGDAVVVNPAPDRRFVWLDNVPVGYVDAGTLYAVHADHLNTPRAVTTAAGTAVWTWAFQGNPFGENAPNADPDGDGAALGYPLRFPGQYDDGGGTYYNYFRDYEPESARYMESDPIGLRGGINTYAYVSGKPLRRSDPRGLDGSIFCGGVHGADAAVGMDGNADATSCLPIPKPPAEECRIPESVTSQAHLGA